MGWAENIAQQVIEALAGRDEVRVAAAAIDAAGAVIRLSEGCPADGRFEVGSATKTTPVRFIGDEHPSLIAEYLM